MFLSFILGLSLALVFNNVVALIGLLFLVLYCWRTKTKFWLMSLAYILGIMRISLIPMPPDFQPGKYEFAATICAEPDLRLDQQKLVLCFAKQKVLATVGLYPPYYYGDQVNFRGKIERPGEIDGFRYDRYLAKQGIYLISRQPSLEKVAEEKRGFFSVLFRLKDNLKKIIDKSMPEPEAGLANALILGYKNTVSREYLDLFSEIGVSHMIAISGTHITIMAMIWQKIMGIFFRRPKLILTISFLSFYVLLTGSSAAALRSLVMGILALVIMSQKGKQNGTWLLIFSAAFMLLINPLWLTADLGFQLSYLAMIALIYIYPWLNSYFVNWPKQRWAQGVWEVFVLTIASQLLTAPLIAVNFGRFSVIAPLANILLLWIFPFLMATLLGGLLLAALLPPLVKIFFLPAYFGLLYIFSAAEIIARVPLATVDWRWNWGGAGLFYSGFFLVYYFFNKQKNRA